MLRNGFFLCGSFRCVICLLLLMLSVCMISGWLLSVLVMVRQVVYCLFLLGVLLCLRNRNLVCIRLMFLVFCFSVSGIWLGRLMLVLMLMWQLLGVWVGCVCCVVLCLWICCCLVIYVCVEVRVVLEGDRQSCLLLLFMIVLWFGWIVNSLVLLVISVGRFSVCERMVVCEVGLFCVVVRLSM